MSLECVDGATLAFDEAEKAVLAIAAGDWDEARTAKWLGGFLTAPAA